MKVDDMQKLERTESMMMRWMCGVSLKERKPTLVLRKSLGIDDVSAVIRCRRLTWFGDVESKDPKDWVAACRELEVVSQGINVYIIFYLYVVQAMLSVRFQNAMHLELKMILNRNSLER